MRKKTLIILILVGLAISASFTYGAPTSTILQNLIINGIKDASNPILRIDSVGLVSTTTDQTGSGAISTSSAVSVNNFPFWTTVGGALSGTSTVTTNAGHITFAASNATTSVCGTGPSNVGSDNAGTITVGTGVVTACTLTFGTTFAATPACTVAINSVAITADVQSVSQTAVTFGFSASVAGGSLYYLCF